MKNFQNTLVTLLVVICCLVTTAIGQRKGTRAVIAEDAPVLLLPEAGRTPLATLPRGTEIEVIGPEEDGWYQVSFQDSYLLGDRVGYVRVKSVRVATAAPAGTARPSPAAEIRPPAPKPGRVRHGLSDDVIAKALLVAARDRGRVHGVRLDAADAPGGAATAAGDAPSADGGIRLEIHTPLAWIQQRAADAAAHDRPFGLADVTDEMTEPVLRVTVYADVAAGPASRPSPVRHVVLRAETGDVSVQPLAVEAFSQHVLSATGRSTASEGLRFTFPLDAVQKLRGPAGSRAVLITVLGATGDAKTLRVQRKHFDALQM